MPLLSLREWLRPPRHLVAIFATVIVLPAAALAWLAVRTLDQDKALARQRVQDRLDGAATSLVFELEQRLDEVARTLPDLAASRDAVVPADSVIVTVTGDGVSDHPAGRLLFVPFVPLGVGPRQELLGPAEAVEIRANDPAAAARLYRRLADGSERQPDRAAALLGLARCLRKAGSPHAALAVYGELERLGAFRISGVPAELVARHAECAVLAELRSPELAARAAVLFSDLQHRRWTLDRAWYELYSDETRAWLPADARPDIPDAAQLALADAAVDVARIHDEQHQRAGRGRKTAWLRAQPLLIVWNDTPDGTTALVAGPGWLEKWAPAWTRQRLAVALVDADSHAFISGPDTLEKPVSVRPASETGLPWTLRVASADAAGELVLASAQQRNVLAGLGLLATLVLAGGYVVARAAFHEFEVARLQTQFVAAVSHEFRSPLTSIKHLVEMLDQDAVPTEERRRRYYHVLAGETERLHRLVEDLLNFQRMEGGRAIYSLGPLDVAALVESVAAEFRAQHAAAGRLAVRIERRDAVVRADREAVSCAIWNLLDNAAKYSPDPEPIALELHADDRRVRILVRDRGEGIAPAERARVFDKFYRAPSATASGVKGTGIGLAIVRHIVRAHHGEILLESRTGEGCTFTIVLPAARAASGDGVA
jgi:signal transduction histidine kinase